MAIKGNGYERTEVRTMLIKGRRCEVEVVERRYPGLRISAESEPRVQAGKDKQFKIPPVSNASGRSSRISREQARTAFKKT